MPQQRTLFRRWRGAWRRWSLWTLLVLLVISMLATMVWLAGRYEASQVQSRLERDTADAVSDIRVALTRNLQSLQALHAGDPGQLAWEVDASELLRNRRELVRIEWRDTSLRVRTHAQSPYRPVAWDARLREGNQSDAAIACANARRLSSPAYSSSYFQPHGDGLGSEMMELCLPLSSGGRSTGFLVATYALQDVLINLVAHNLTRSQEASFTEADGTRLAVLGAARRGSRMFTATHLLDLPGSTLVLRMDTWHSAPSLFPNVLTALVTAMSIALVTVMVVLVRDNRRRLRAERDLADALAFRKAMEDSLVTGLRARDLEGRITYVNPAFCAMVGFSAPELLGQSVTAPYWPPERVEEYRQRQAIRFAGTMPPREGFESEFMRKDGTRFPVLIIEAPLINAQGLHTGWMSAFLDISEQRRVEELSRASQERLQATARLATVGEMASLLSHELNQPLAAISSYATGSINLLEAPAPQAGSPAGAAPNAEQLQDVRMAMQHIARQAERAGKVIKSVHDFVRRRDQAREAVQARQLLDAILPLVSLQARKLAVRVNTTVEPNLPPVLCDRTMVEQVLLNLARNAMQAMDDPAIPTRVLDIRVRRAASNQHSGWIEFAVTDLGTGIAADVAKKLFTPFFTTRAEGMGLGLSMCRTVIEQHGGFLGFAPHEPRGTVFTFTLPVPQPSPDT
ncbi:PAS domain S-box protein [Acidovorax sp. sif1233]|uniref:two-component system sensor histidine kinase NtrB n=1 Tax=Acidovorax sp. A79 TaxID=3056107 RepID=UPI001C4412AE|nr:PAS domain S-box protein [Acidovorax sp. sif0732]MBV7449066.1 PAS domain S-box protein [Acidovorax sp. sif0715]MBV7457022.1 PAS domain S-box protein [Acidovorax sp. sif1233]